MRRAMGFGAVRFRLRSLPELTLVGAGVSTQLVNARGTAQMLTERGW